MVRKLLVLLGTTLVVATVSLGTPAQAEAPSVAVRVEDTCGEVPPDDVDFPAACIDGEWVSTDDGEFGGFDDDFEEADRNFTTFAVLGFLVVAGLGIGGAIWRASAARGMARRSGMNEEDAANVALLGGHGIEAAYLASAFRPPAQGAAEPTGEDAATRLAELQRLRDQGVITYDEYEVQRKKIIEDI